MFHDERSATSDNFAGFVEKRATKLSTTAMLDRLKNFILKTLRFAILTGGTTSAIYALLALPRLLEKEHTLENTIRKRLSLEKLISSQNEEDEMMKKAVLELRSKQKLLKTLYYKLNRQEANLSQTVYKYIKECECDSEFSQQPHQLHVNDREQDSSTLGAHDNQEDLLIEEVDEHHREKQNHQAGDGGKYVVLQKSITAMHISSMTFTDDTLASLTGPMREKQQHNLLAKMFKKKSKYIGASGDQ
ncbi:unnamed protein product [Didymodactylos carnosus]|uniref:Uncharacterized protein n=1 Tax=Didymodactylos carnosus TaxID=1234261 RepID=A0A814BAW0_9BILA|nr:unnamed protein product [Didymodactylos carnosus]CAF0925076.1 unnamed protein product [Didymodactylos carnosus]CAF0925093.1 unnamed protein product [Didymodactylos carnosus]CAF3520344.1 unnamed protein product [Didymodactylos carnosus]CAF3703855.1 unnamed protein product [Didymodactylos carnosus]